MSTGRLILAIAIGVFLAYVLIHASQSVQRAERAPTVTYTAPAPTELPAGDRPYCAVPPCP